MNLLYSRNTNFIIRYILFEQSVLQYPSMIWTTFDEWVLVKYQVTKQASKGYVYEHYVKYNTKDIIIINKLYSQIELNYYRHNIAKIKMKLYWV